MIVGNIFADNGVDAKNNVCEERGQMTKYQVFAFHQLSIF